MTSAAISTGLPLTGEAWIDFLWVPEDLQSGFERPKANVRFVSQDYFKTMGIPFLAGRSFSASDRLRKVTVISEQLAGILWPGPGMHDRGRELYQISRNAAGEKTPRASRHVRSRDSGVRI